MRPKTRNRIVRNAIESYLKGNTKKLYGKIVLKALYEQLDWIRMGLKRIYEENPDIGNFKKDTRSGYETYGYTSRESILGNMYYISDRWQCEFRINWLLAGIKDKHF